MNAAPLVEQLRQELLGLGVSGWEWICQLMSDDSLLARFRRRMHKQDDEAAFFCLRPRNVHLPRTWAQGQRNDPLYNTEYDVIPIHAIASLRQQSALYPLLNDTKVIVTVTPPQTMIHNLPANFNAPRMFDLLHLFHLVWFLREGLAHRHVYLHNFPTSQCLPNSQVAVDHALGNVLGNARNNSRGNMLGNTRGNKMDDSKVVDPTWFDYPVYLPDFTTPTLEEQHLCQTSANWTVAPDCLLEWYSDLMSERLMRFDYLNPQHFYELDNRQQPIPLWKFEHELNEETMGLSASSNLGDEEIGLVFLSQIKKKKKIRGTGSFAMTGLPEYTWFWSPIVVADPKAIDHPSLTTSRCIAPKAFLDVYGIPSPSVPLDNDSLNPNPNVSVVNSSTATLKTTEIDDSENIIAGAKPSSQHAPYGSSILSISSSESDKSLDFDESKVLEFPDLRPLEGNASPTPTFQDFHDSGDMGNNFNMHQVEDPMICFDS